MIQNNILVNNNNNSNNSFRFFSSLCETNSILQPSWGTGPATFSRASAQYITDFEGVTRKVESNCVAVEGSRVVTNLLTYSEDLSNAAWIASGATKNGNILTINNLNDRVYQAVTLSLGVPFRVTVSFSSGDVGKVFRFFYYRDADVYSANYTVPTSGRVSFTATPSSAVTYVGFASASSVAEAYTLTLVNLQLENVTAQSNPNPGEYVKTTSAAVSKCFATQNGNTVDGNGVVTEATGTALPQSHPERANSTAYALNDKIQVNGWWYNCTTAGTSTSSAPTFATGKAGLVTVTDGTVTWTLGGRLLLGYVSEPASTNKVTAYGTIPADTLGSELSSGSLTIGQKYQITARTDANFVADGAADNVVGTQFVATAATVTLDVGDKVKRVQWGVGEKSFHNGSSFVQNISGLTLSGDVAAVLSIVTDETEIVKAGLARINPGYKVYKLDNSGGSTNATVLFSGATGNTNVHSFKIPLRGTGTAVYGGNWSGSEQSTSAITASYVNYKKDGWAAANAGTQGKVTAYPASVVYFLLPQLEELPYATSIMPTAGATATRAATSLSYPTAGNLRVSVGTAQIETFLNSGSQVARVLQVDDSGRLIYLNSGAFTAYDGVNSGAIGPTPTANTLYKILVRYSGSSLKGFTNGTAYTGFNFDGSMGSGSTLYVGGSGSSAYFNGYLRNLKIWFKPLSDDRCKQLTL